MEVRQSWRHSAGLGREVAQLAGDGYDALQPIGCSGVGRQQGQQGAIALTLVGRGGKRFGSGTALSTGQAGRDALLKACQLLPRYGGVGCEREVLLNKIDFRVALGQDTDALAQAVLGARCRAWDRVVDCPPGLTKRLQRGREQHKGEALGGVLGAAHLRWPPGAGRAPEREP